MGRGHDPDGIVNTKEGECGLLCPACPQPGINLPDQWESAAPEKRSDHLPPIVHLLKFYN